MRTDILSDIELYFSDKIENEYIILVNDEAHHAIKVMRHNLDDKLFVTDGNGFIYQTTIENISKKGVIVKIDSKKFYENKFQNITFCIPRIKNQERFEFALEKCVELGITNFIVFDSERSIAKGDKTDRWQKILIAAMKQSLNAYLPKVKYVSSFEKLLQLEGKKFIFEQTAVNKFDFILNKEFDIINSQLSIFIFGPEGGFSNNEMKLIDEEMKIKLTNQRLRSETAIIAAASLLAIKLSQ